MGIRIADCWARIEAWLAANVQEAVPLLPAGATSAALATAEKTLGYALPGDLQEFLVIHDGSAHLWLHDRGEFMAFDAILAAWDQEFDLWGDGNNDEWARPEGPIQKKWFTRKWLPILDARTGDYVCIDLDPPEGGKMGQLITWRHDGGPGGVIAASLAELLAEFVAELDEGRYAPKLDRVGQPYLEYR